MTREIKRHLRARPLGQRFSSRGFGGGSAVPALPAAANLIGKYEAGVGITKTGDDIDQWDDQSGNGNHMTQAGATALKPQDLTDSDGNSGVVFLKTRSGYLDIPTGVNVDARDCSFFVIGDRTADISGGGYDDQSYLIGFGTSAGDIGLQANHTASLKIEGFDGARRITTLPATNCYFLYGMVSDASASTVYQNGNGQATTIQIDADTDNPGGRLGNHGSVTSLEWRGTIRAVLIYDRALSAAEIDAVEEWARHFYTTPRDNIIQIAFHGDSLTSGTGVTNPADAYPSQLGRLRAWDFDGVNAGWPGIGRPQIITEGTNDIDPFYDATTYTQARICILWVGTNNLSIGQTAAAILTDLQTYASDRQTTGWTVLVCTILPQVGITAGEETERTTLNSDIITNTGSWHDGSIDLAGDSRLQDETDTTYFNADQVHLNETGYGVVASLVNTALGAFI